MAFVRDGSEGMGLLREWRVRRSLCPYPFGLRTGEKFLDFRRRGPSSRGFPPSSFSSKRLALFAALRVECFTTGAVPRAYIAGNRTNEKPQLQVQDESSTNLDMLA